MNVRFVRWCAFIIIVLVLTAILTGCGRSEDGWTGGDMTATANSPQAIDTGS